MARQCDLTGKKAVHGRSISHAHNVTSRVFQPNLQKKRIWLEEEGRWITIRATAKALKTLDKKGYKAMMKELAKKSK